MNSLIIEQSNLSTEQVDYTIIDKLYRLALTSNAEDPQNNFEMRLVGSIRATAAYEDAVRYLNAKFSPNLMITVLNDNYYIRFKDPIVKRICEQKWGDSVTGGVTKSMAASITSLDNVFKNASDKASITSFNEFLYFTGINNCGDQFRDLPNLQEITMPPMVKFSGRLFWNVGNASSSPLTIHWNDCTIYNYNKNYTLMFRDCHNLPSDIMLPIQASYKMLGVLSTDYDRNSFIDPFWGCNNLQKVIFLEGIKEAGFSAQGMASLLYIEYPESLEWNGPWYNFSNGSPKINCVVFKSKTPPIAWTGYKGWTGLNNGKLPVAIYVPNDAVNTYKSQALWGNNRPNSVPNTSEGAGVENFWAYQGVSDIIKPFSDIPPGYLSWGTLTAEDISGNTTEP